MRSAYSPLRKTSVSPPWTWLRPLLRPPGETVTVLAKTGVLRSAHRSMRLAAIDNCLLCILSYPYLSDYWRIALPSTTIYLLVPPAVLIQKLSPHGAVVQVREPDALA